MWWWKEGRETTIKTGSGVVASQSFRLTTASAKPYAITAVVQLVSARTLLAAIRIKDFFKNADGAHREEMLVEQSVSATGGPQVHNRQGH